MNNHLYHLVDPSPWPTAASLAALLLTVGGVMYMCRYSAGELVVSFGISLVFYSMFVWWRNVIRESTFQGHHTSAVQTGLWYGVILFIVSEFMLFSVLLCHFFYSAFTLPVEIKTPYKVFGFCAEWTSADYALFITVLVIFFCSFYGGGDRMSKKDKKNSNNISQIVIPILLIVGILFSFTLFYLESHYQEEIHQQVKHVLESPTHEKIGLVLVVLLIPLLWFLFREGRKWVVTRYGVTCYYLVIMGIRAVLVWFKMRPDHFFFLGVVLLIGAIVVASLFGEKKSLTPIEWGKKIIESLFYLQLSLLVVYLVVLVFSQSTPCSWVYTNIIFFLFEAAFLVGKVLVEITPPDGIFWGNFKAGIEKIRILVDGDHAPAFLGGEESAHEKQSKTAVPNASLMQPAGQGGLPHGVDVDGLRDLARSSLNIEMVIQWVEGSSCRPPIHPLARAHDLLNTRDGTSLSGVRLDYKDNLCSEAASTDAFVQKMLRNPNVFDLGKVVYLGNLTNTAGGFYLEASIYDEINLPACPDGDHLELINGKKYKWVPANLHELKMYMQRFGHVGVNTENLRLRRIMGSELTLGTAKYKLVQTVEEQRMVMVHKIPSICVNGKVYYMELPQPQLPASVGEYKTSIKDAILLQGHENESHRLDTNDVVDLCEQLWRNSTEQARARLSLMLREQGQAIGVGPQPDQGGDGVGGDGQSDQPTPPAATTRADASEAVASHTPPGETGHRLAGRNAAFAGRNAAFAGRGGGRITGAGGGRIGGGNLGLGGGRAETDCPAITDR